MVFARRTLIAIATILSCYIVSDTQQHWKSHKPYAWDGRPKYLHSIVIKSPPSPPSPSAIYLSSDEKTFKPPNHCDLRKVVFTQGAESPQFVVYKTKIPDLKEFTLCHWHSIFNYTHDQPIFAYTHHGKSRTIYSWIENTPEKSYYSLAINGHTIYRINYPEKLFKWYHVCQSWNGHTGEWQLWINTERVGRGFYNLMVGKVIKGGGIAYSGREYLEQALAVHYPAYSGEMTLLSLYKAALTAGKAYNDHKHHHVHNFHHGYDEAVDEADTEEPAAAPAFPEPTRPPHLAHGGLFVNGQLLPKLPVVPVTVSPANVDQPETHPQPLFEDGGLYDFYSPLRTEGDDDTFHVNLLDRDDDGGRNKRNATGRPKRWTPVSEHKKPVGIARSGDPTREPAEWEVNNVASMCSGCSTDPFGAAAILSWRNTRKQFYNGALYVSALPKCYLF